VSRADGSSSGRRPRRRARTPKPSKEAALLSTREKKRGRDGERTIEQNAQKTTKQRSYSLSLFI
jgi:hypothetical protein